MQLWKLGCRWGSAKENKPLFYDFLLKNRMVIGWIDKDYRVNDWILLTNGQTVLAFAKILEERQSILDFLKLEQDCSNYEIPFDENIFCYKAEIIILKKEDRFFYQLQQGICRVQNTSIIEQFKKKLEYYQSINMNSDKLNLLKYKKQIILQGPPGTGKTRLAKIIAEKLCGRDVYAPQVIKETVFNLTKDFIKSKIKEGDIIKSKSGKELTIVDVKDNVISVKSENSKDWSPSYSKIIVSFNNKFWEQKGRTGGYKPYEDALAKYFYDNFCAEVETKEIDLIVENENLKLIQFHPSYTYEDFVRGIVANPNENGDGIFYNAENKLLGLLAKEAGLNPDENYVLIIDEINRANLSSVLGELIYALEYRGEEVESMYEVGGSNKMTLPPNLYIIGTMNTADRSIGHIDYAIRRRFAFVDVPPIDLSLDLGDDFHTELYYQVEKLFTDDYLSPEFKAKDVQLGHSYFIQQYEKDSRGRDIKDKPHDFKLRIEYEILPLLMEYLKDGVLNEKALDKINDIRVNYFSNK